jgi:hypothetical protein
MCPQRLNRVTDGSSETEGDLRKILVHEVVAKLANKVVAGCLPVEKPSRPRAGLMLGQQAVSALVDGAPKVGFREFLGCQPFREQRVKFVRCPGKPRQSALFDRRQGSFDNLLNGGVGATTHDCLQPTLLFWREVDGHGDRFSKFISQGKRKSDQITTGKWSLRTSETGQPRAAVPPKPYWPLPPSRRDGGATKPTPSGCAQWRLGLLYPPCGGVRFRVCPRAACLWPGLIRLLLCRS